MCWIMSHHILEQVGTARGALGRARCTTLTSPMRALHGLRKRQNFRIFCPR